MSARSVHLSKKNVSIVLAALEEIDYHFDAIGMAEPEVKEVLPEPNDDVQPTPQGTDGEHPDSDAQDEEEEGYYPAKIFQREEIEIAIDAFLTQLFKKKLVTKDRQGRPPSLSEALRHLFGEDDDLASIADSFEEHIKGYFDCISYDDMSAAYEEFVRIRDIIKARAA